MSVIHRSVDNILAAAEARVLTETQVMLDLLGMFVQATAELIVGTPVLPTRYETPVHVQKMLYSDGLSSEARRDTSPGTRMEEASGNSGLIVVNSLPAASQQLPGGRGGSYALVLEMQIAILELIRSCTTTSAECRKAVIKIFESHKPITQNLADHGVALGRCLTHALPVVLSVLIKSYTKSTVSVSAASTTTLANTGSVIGKLAESIVPPPIPSTAAPITETTAEVGMKNDNKESHLTEASPTSHTVVDVRVRPDGVGVGELSDEGKLTSGNKEEKSGKQGTVAARALSPVSKTSSWWWSSSSSASASASLSAAVVVGAGSGGAVSYGALPTSTSCASPRLITTLAPPSQPSASALGVAAGAAEVTVAGVSGGQVSGGLSKPLTCVCVRMKYPPFNDALENRNILVSRVRKSY